MWGGCGVSEGSGLVVRSGPGAVKAAPGAWLAVKAAVETAFFTKTHYRMVALPKISPVLGQFTKFSCGLRRGIKNFPLCYMCTGVSFVLFFYKF